MEYRSPIDMLYHWEKTTPDKIYLRQPIDGKWHTWTWKEAADEVKRMASVLKAKNLPPKSNIAMISKNCAHWIMSDMAIMMAGHISVPLYPNLNERSVKEILEHSEAKLLFVGKLDDWHLIKPGVPENLECISFPFYVHEEYPNWADLIKNTDPLDEHVTLNEDELATIVYTSGTTGMPKGVMHNYGNLSFAISKALPFIGVDNSDRFFSYLPLSHIAERILIEMGSIYGGAQVSFAESIDTFQQNLIDTKPTVFLGVPRIWTKFQQGILAKLPQEKLNKLLKIPLVSTLVKNKIKKGLGLTKAKNTFSGAAPIPASLLEWFKTIGIKIQEAYAATENCCYSHVTLSKNIKIGFVGQPLPECEVRLGEEDEIQIKHKALTQGYFKEPEKTKELFTEDGFLRTGDQGFIDKDGFLRITGRVKDIFKTSKGKYVAPSPIELELSKNHEIEQVCVVGSGLSQPIALVTLSELGKNQGKTAVETVLNESLKKLNPTLNSHERVEKIIIVRDEWTIENNVLTPSLKIKRNEVDKIYASYYDSWYQLNEKVVWE